MFSIFTLIGTESLFSISSADLTVISFWAEPCIFTSHTILAGGISVRELVFLRAATFLKKVPTLSTVTGLISFHPSTLTTTWCSWWW